MAATFIPIAGGSTHGSHLQAYRNALKLVITDGPLILSKMATMIDTVPNPDDFSALETAFGLPSGTGETCKGELTAVTEALQANPADSAAQAGNAALLATKLRQFVDKVG